jgi:hypothetical protein
MKKTRLIVSVLSFASIVVFLTACSGTFIQDPIDPRLPKYTEEGNDAAGAFVNGEVWRSVVTSGFLNTSNEPSIRSWPKRDSLLITFSGNIVERDYTIAFQLKGYEISEVEDLMALDGKKIELDGINNAGYWMSGYSSSIYSNRGIGQIYFKKVKKIEASSFIIISGTFAFKITDTEGGSIRISSGRFDYRISNMEVEE